MLITEMLADNARRFGDEVALVERRDEGRRELTWKQFDADANRVANALLARGISRGDRVAILMTNRLEWLPIYFGVLRTGAWAVPLSFRLTRDDVRRCVQVARAGAVFVSEDLTDRVPLLPSVVVVGGGDAGSAVHLADFINNSPPHAPGLELAADDEAALYFSSGTTGEPKTILITHANLAFAAKSENEHHGQTHADNFLCIAPLFHTGAKIHWFGNLIVGGRAVILRGVEARKILAAVSEEKVSVVFLLVPWAQDILVAIESGAVDLADYDLSSWRVMHIGAQPVPPSLIERWLRVFPTHRYDTNYGLSETTGPGCVHLGFENRHKVGAIGRAGFGWQCRIVDDENRQVVRGTVGELAVRGPGVMKEYYGDAEATGGAIREGWLLTGDMAREDDDGFIWLVDRKKDLVIVGGENVYPVEIEAHLVAHDAIQDAAVIAIADDRLGEVPAAVIALKPGRELSAEEVVRFCESLPRHKRPRKVFFGEVPRNPTGKIEKPELRARYR